MQIAIAGMRLDLIYILHNWMWMFPLPKNAFWDTENIFQIHEDIAAFSAVVQNGKCSKWT